jgi:hypothetical protein
MKSARTPSLCSAFYLSACAALALCAFGNHSAWAQFPPPPGAAQPPAGTQCGDFNKLGAEAQKRSALVAAAIKAKADRKELCSLITNFFAAEGNLVKFLEDNKTWCGIPDQAISMAKANHEKSAKYRTAACEEAPHPKAPTLSDAIKTPSVDSSNNTKTGRGTFDTLTGNPLAR